LHHRVLNFVARDGLLIDHINRDPLDNRKSNLRIADVRLQAQNRRMIKNNTSGVHGVYLKEGSAWAATWVEDGKAMRRSFSIKKYGDEGAKALAIALRQEKVPVQM
jgi:hypothetical protein